MRSYLLRTALAAAIAGVGITAALASSPDPAGGDRAEPVQTRADVDVDALRARGPAGLQALLNEHSALVAKVREGADLTAAEQATWGWLQPALDAVAQQRDAWAAGLYWYTDMNAAKAEAKRTGRPILSLRMLGSLTDELSCANSRFFRSVLYPDPAVADLLRRHFVLHWSSERAVPKVTIDMGDGRVIHSTITGNSIHYVLDGDGRPIDALPGLYDAQTFRAALDDALGLHRRLSIAGDARAALLAQWHQERAQLKGATLARAMGAEGMTIKLATGRDLPTKARVPAAKAIPVAITKARVEAPVNPTPAPLFTDVDGSDLTPAQWGKLAARLGARGRLSAEARAFVLRKSGSAIAAHARAEGISPEAAADARVAALEALVRQDTALNEWELHRRLHRWFADRDVSTWKALNERVYAKLFLTPRTDRWLGLVGSDLYTGVQDDGLTLPSAQLGAVTP